MYNVKQTRKAKEDVKGLAAYMLYSLKNGQAANRFLSEYENQIEILKIFPFGYQGVNFEYDGEQIRLKVFLSYNIFFVVDAEKQEITILRVLKDLQDWKTILLYETDYSF